MQLFKTRLMVEQKKIDAGKIWAVDQPLSDFNADCFLQHLFLYV